MSLPIGIGGGGAFGRALALAAARAGRSVILWSRQDRRFTTPRVRCTTELTDLAEAELIFMAVPSPHVGEIGRELGRCLDGSHLLCHVSRGLIGDELQRITETLRRVTPVRRVGVLAGPLVARGLAEGQPGGGVVGTLFPEVAEAVREAIAGPALRIYSTQDVVGAELASAFVGMVAVALGYARAAGFGPATLAVLATRAMAEAVRVCARQGAEQKTFSGLAGTGDLIAAVAGDGRPELEFGRALHDGATLEEAARRSDTNVEGVAIARHVVAYADRHTIDAPIARALDKLATGVARPKQVVDELMSRPTRSE